VTPGSMSSADWVSDAQEILWAVGKQYGQRLDATDQVAVARQLAHSRPEAVTVEHVAKAFVAARLPAPSDGFAREVVARVRRLHPRPSLTDVLLSFRQEAIRTLSRQYGGKPKKEDELRRSLLMYLPMRGYAEAHTGRGQTDVLIPAPDDVVIETKVWTTELTFEDGMAELGKYIHTEKPKQAFMVVFSDREPLPTIIDSDDQAIAEVRDLAGLRVPVIVVPFEVEPPSTVGAAQRRRGKRAGR
jgi:hypothetical protein